MEEVMDINKLSTEIKSLREKCLKMRELMDEGTHKLNSTVNILEKLKSQEQNMVNSVDGPREVRPMNEEHINSMLEMLKTPAFQNLARQMLLKWSTQKD